ncbi:helix-turn-helix transcriptional regulator [Heyndrickxia ginsengihumi]|uniref:helix-turn-helix transcriptional regulator n=1 Tax=Heyndrickxia ginsengihumi TaxID=363870 RepID=UPI003D1D385D
MNAEIFRAIRLKKGMTQSKYANLLGISESTVAAIENGRRGISDQVRARLAREVEIDEELLYFLESYRKLGNINPF